MTPIPRGFGVLRHSTLIMAQAVTRLFPGPLGIGPAIADGLITILTCRSP